MYVRIVCCRSEKINSNGEHPEGVRNVSLSKDIVAVAATIANVTILITCICVGLIMCVCVCVFEVLRLVPRGFSRGEIAKQQSYVLGIYLTVFKSIITPESKFQNSEST